ncbi:unnamed protein product [Somion occarium]|uniref:Ricin B lectin domain-containing protein n=1 Tax=Somion occarium TaxID=3059160 RepID=A0ABP1CSD6_9APHY
MSDPLTTVNYRIQNLDYLSYIEFPGFTTSIQLRPFKANELKQQWKFVDAGNGAFYIQSIVDADKYLGYSGGYLAVLPKASAWTWTVFFDAKSSSYSIYYSLSYVLQAENTSVVSLTSRNAYDNQRWSLIPVTPATPNRLPLPTGYYRVRTFNGLSLMTLPKGVAAEDSSVFVQSQVASNDAYQRWLVTRQQNGLYLVQSAGPATPTYLGCNSAESAVGDHLVGIATPFEWDLRQIGQGLAWSINLPQYPSALSLGFADYEAESGDDISLEPTDTAPSQIWFFESYVPLGNDTVHAKREVEEGNYQLQSYNDSTTYMTVLSSPYRITPGTSTSTKFALKYTEDAAQFTLSYATSSGAIPVADCGGFLGFATEGTNWVLLPGQLKVVGFYICRPDAGSPHKVVSGRITSDINQNKVFSIDNMVSGAGLQMWKLIKA